MARPLLKPHVNFFWDPISWSILYKPSAAPANFGCPWRGKKKKKRHSIQDLIHFFNYFSACSTGTFQPTTSLLSQKETRCPLESIKFSKTSSTYLQFSHIFWVFLYFVCWLKETYQLLVEREPGCQLLFLSNNKLTGFPSYSHSFFFLKK